MKTVHRIMSGPRRGKVVVAVYLCEVRAYPTDAQLCQMWPRSYGRSTTPFHVTRGDGFTRWYHLVANTAQTTPADLVRRIEKVMRWPKNDARISVEIVAGLPEHGEATRIGTPRTGTVRTLASRPQARGVAAR